MLIRREPDEDEEQDHDGMRDEHNLAVKSYWAHRRTAGVPSAPDRNQNGSLHRTEQCATPTGHARRNGGVPSALLLPREPKKLLAVGEAGAPVSVAGRSLRCMPKKYREVRTALSEAGWEVLRQRGSHEIWASQVSRPGLWWRVNQATPSR
jgi:hypothetical protein